jgi:hypothetical protein
MSLCMAWIKYCRMKFTLQFSLLILISIYAYTQPPPIFPTFQNNMQKVIIISHEKTGRSDTIKIGTFIKLWFWSDKKRDLEQPIMRTDFRRHTYYIESNLIGVTDTTLIFLKRPPFIPLPIPLKIPTHDFDTVKITEIRSIRPLNKSIEAPVKGVVMMPAMTFMPEYFTTFPGMLLVMPAMQLTTTYFGDVVFPFHKMNRDSNFSLHVGEIPADTFYYIQKRKMKSETDYEWEIERLERYDKMYNHMRKELSDQLLDTYLGNKILSLTLGTTMIPGFYKGNEDLKTRINIAERKFFFGLSSENFITERHRIGLEIQMNRTERYMSVTGSGSPYISASTGFILSNFSYFKWGLEGIYSRQYKARQWAAIKSLDDEITKENDETELGYLTARRSFLRGLLAAEPLPYVMLGLGSINTTLIKIKGSQVSGINSTDYSQQLFALEGGVGIFTRMGKRISYDLSAKYLWSPRYSPEIGGLERYSGFRLQINIGYMTGPSFTRYRRILREVGMKKD